MTTEAASRRLLEGLAGIGHEPLALEFFAQGVDAAEELAITNDQPEDRRAAL